MDIDLINLIRLFAFLLVIDFTSGVIKSAKLGELKNGEEKQEMRLNVSARYHSEEQ